MDRISRNFDETSGFDRAMTVALRYSSDEYTQDKGGMS
jgi:hypothetical protein